MATALAVPALQKGHPLVVNVSSPGAVIYLDSVAHDAGKAAVDKLPKDMAHELREHRVAVVSIWPGLVRTEFLVQSARIVDGREFFDLPGEALDLSDAESPRFSGRAVVALYRGDDRMERSGNAFLVRTLAEEYGFTDSAVVFRGSRIKPIQHVGPKTRLKSAARNRDVSCQHPCTRGNDNRYCRQCPRRILLPCISADHLKSSQLNDHEYTESQ